MKYRILSFIVVALLLLVCTGTVSAFEFDNVKAYDALTKTVEITNAFGFGATIAEIKLNTPINYVVPRGYQKVAEFTINNYDDSYANAFGKMKFFNLNNYFKGMEREFDYKYLVYEDVEVNDYKEVCDSSLSNGTLVCRQVIAGIHIEQKEVWLELDTALIIKGETTVGIFTDVQPGDHVDWVPTLFGIEINEWATWTESLSSGLMEYWSMDQDTGANVVNNITGGTDGTIAGGATWVAGKVGSGINFLQNSYVSLNGVTSTTKEYTMAFWIKTADNRTDLKIIDIQLGRLVLSTYDGFLFPTPGALSTTDIDDNAWKHVAINWDPDTDDVLIYINGALSETLENNYTVDKDIGGAIRLGARYDGEDGNIMILDELGIWNRSLSAGEVEDLYNSGDGIGYLVDTDGPIIVIEYPLNDTYTVDVTDLNYTVSDITQQYCWYSFDDGATNSTLQECGTNWTSLSSEEGQNEWIVFGNDTAGLENQTTVTFWKDTILPNLNIINPTEDFIWYGWDTDGDDTILVDLNWTTNDTNQDACWYTNGTSVNVTVTCGDNATDMNITYGTYDWYVWANDTSNNTGYDTQTTRYAALINNSHTGNTTTYETKSETFAVNVTYPSAEFTSISAKLNYSGTSYTATRTGAGDFAVFTYTLDIPTVGNDVTNHTYNFNISLNNGTQFYYVTDERNITVTPIIFQECNGTFLPFLNYTFKDEETDGYISASVPNADFDFWLGSGSVKDSYNFADAVDTTSYEFCFSLNETINIDLEFQYEQDPGYTVRAESYSDGLSNDTTYKILFLTGTANGQYITFQLQDSTGTGVPDVVIQMERKIGGAWTTIGTDNSDDAGQVVFYLDITLDHRLTITHDDYVTEILTIRPSQAVYTIILQLVGGEPAEYTSPLEGINYYISPTPGPWLSENTNYTFTYNISANLSNLIFYSMNITLSNGTELASVYGTTSTGGDLTIFLNTSDYNRLYGYYYIDVGNGTFLIDPSIWVLRDITPGNLSIYNFFVYLKSTETDIEDNYTHLFFLFFFFFLAMAAFTLSTGMELAQPGICLILVFFFVAICSLTGYFTIDFAPGDFINKYGILLVVFLLTGGYTLGQWART